MVDNMPPPISERCCRACPASSSCPDHLNDSEALTVSRLWPLLRLHRPSDQRSARGVHMEGLLGRDSGMMREDDDQKLSTRTLLA